MNLQDIQNIIAATTDVDDLNTVSKMLREAIAARKVAQPKGKVGRPSILGDATKLTATLAAIRDNDTDNIPCRAVMAKLMEAGFIENFATFNEKNRAVRGIRLTQKGIEMVEPNTVAETA